MLRVNCHALRTDGPNECWSHPMRMWAANGFFERDGISFVGEIDGPADWWWIDSRTIEEGHILDGTDRVPFDWRDWIDTRKNVTLWHWQDQVCLLNRDVRQFANHPHCRLVVKPFAYRNGEDENGAHSIAGTRWGLDFGEGLRQPFDVRADYQDKIRTICLWWWWNFDWHRSERRIIDAAFVGTSTSYWNIAPCRHRQTVLEELRSLPTDVTVCCGGGKASNDGHRMNALGLMCGWTEHQHLLSQTHVAVSPYGYEAASFRDLEAIAAGCYLLKPGMNRYVTWPRFPDHGVMPLLGSARNEVDGAHDRNDFLAAVMLGASHSRRYRAAHNATADEFFALNQAPHRAIQMIANWHRELS